MKIDDLIMSLTNFKEEYKNLNVLIPELKEGCKAISDFVLFSNPKEKDILLVERSCAPGRVFGELPSVQTTRPKFAVPKVDNQFKCDIDCIAGKDIKAGMLCELDVSTGIIKIKELK
jgi:hypothetical protein